MLELTTKGSHHDHVIAFIVTNSFSPVLCTEYFFVGLQWKTRMTTSCLRRCQLTLSVKVRWYAAAR